MSITYIGILRRQSISRSLFEYRGPVLLPCSGHQLRISPGASESSLSTVLVHIAGKFLPPEVLFRHRNFQRHILVSRTYPVCLCAIPVCLAGYGNSPTCCSQ